MPTSRPRSTRAHVPSTSRPRVRASKARWPPLPPPTAGFFTVGSARLRPRVGSAFGSFLSSRSTSAISLSQSCSFSIATLCLPSQSVALNLLIEIAARHVQCARGLRHMPVVFLQLRQDVGALRDLLEFLEGGRAHPRRSSDIGGPSLSPVPRRSSYACHAIDVHRRDHRPGREDEDSLDGVPQLADVAGPIV